MYAKCLVAQLAPLSVSNKGVLGSDPLSPTIELLKRKRYQISGQNIDSFCDQSTAHKVKFSSTKAISKTPNSLQIPIILFPHILLATKHTSYNSFTLKTLNY